jgi:hypothetical protein
MIVPHRTRNDKEAAIDAIQRNKGITTEGTDGHRGKERVKGKG